MVKKLPNAANFGVPTTLALVRISEPTFADALGNPDSAFLSYPVNVNFNGTAPEQGENAVVPVGATLTQKQNAVRLKVNAMLQTYEPGVSLNNAEILIFPGLGI